MDRRFLLAGGIAALCAHSAPVFAQDPTEVEDFPELIGELPPLPSDLADFANYEPAQYTELSQVGKGAPSTVEMESAYRILVDSPYNTTSLAVAEYFHNLVGDDAKFRREWPIRANPVIYHFFTATNTAPLGDTTAWCAAAMNWFMLRAKASSKEQIGRSPGKFSKAGEPFTVDQLRRYSTRSASSGSFRCLTKTTTPQKGDFLVLANYGTLGATSQCLGKGHVTIYLGMNGGGAECLGGNQTSPGSGGAITKARFNIGPGSRFFSFVRPLA